MSKKRTGFRAWFYLRMGYTIYWAFLIMGINTLTVTYYLAIEKAPFLQVIFPSFVHYAVTLVIVAVPILVLTGFVHYRKIPGYKSEAEVNVENNPYTYKVAPGWARHVMIPYFLFVTNALLKISKAEKLSEEDMKDLENIQKKIHQLLKGEYVGLEGRVVSFGKSEDE